MTDSLKNNRNNKRLLWVALLLLLPPLAFWLMLQTGSTGNIGYAARFWNYMPESLFKAIIIFLPIPALILSFYAFVKSLKMKTMLGLSLVSLLVSTILVFYCAMKAFLPLQ